MRTGSHWGVLRGASAILWLLSWSPGCSTDTGGEGAAAGSGGTTAAAGSGGTTAAAGSGGTTAAAGCGGATTTGGSGGAPLGQPCVDQSDCASGSCADGVCCDEACDGPCVACTAALKGSGTDGQCGAVPAGADPEDDCPTGSPAACESSPDGLCDGEGACTKWPSGTVCAGVSCSNDTAYGQGTCDGAGTCQTGQATPCDPYACSAGACLSSCVTSAECSAVAACDAGSCVKKAAGLPCSSGAECQSLACTDGVCCATPCDGLCESCDQPGFEGTCSPMPAGSSDADTCPAPHTCDGNGACPGNQPAGTPCPFEPWNADPKSDGCNPGLYCVDGVCCTSKCTDACRSCKVAGSIGTCVPIANAWDSWPPKSFGGEDSCGPPQACPLKCDECGPAATCIHWNGDGCGSNDDCQSGYCNQHTCCWADCQGPCKVCSAGVPSTCQTLPDGFDPNGKCGADGACYKGACKTKPGSPCAADGDCGVGVCADGVCCDQACPGLCKRCAPETGLCGFIPAGQDPDDECPCPQTCDGNGACQ